MPKRRDVVQTKLFMSNKGTGWLRLKALCLVMPKYMVLCLNMPTRKNIVQIEVSLIQSALVCLRPCCLIMPKNMVLCLYMHWLVTPKGLMPCHA